MTPDIAIAAGVLGLLVLLAVPHAAKGRLLARLVRAQREWTEQMDRRAEPNQPPPPALPCSTRTALPGAERAARLTESDGSGPE